MADNYTEIVQFEWRIEQTETAGQAMLDKLALVNTALGTVATNATAMGAAIVAGFSAGGAAADAFLIKLKAISEFQAGMGGVPPMGGGGRPGGGGGGSDFREGTTIGPYYITPGGSVRYAESGRTVKKVDLPQQVNELAETIAADAAARARAMVIDKLNPGGGSGMGAWNPSQSFIPNPSESRANLPSSGFDYTTAGQLAGGLISPKLLPTAPIALGPGPVTYDLNTIQPALQASNTFKSPGRGSGLPYEAFPPNDQPPAWLTKLMAEPGVDLTPLAPEYKTPFVKPKSSFEIADEMRASDAGTIASMEALSKKWQDLMAPEWAKRGMFIDQPPAAAEISGVTRGEVAPEFREWMRENLRLTRAEAAFRNLPVPRGSVSSEFGDWMSANSRQLADERLGVLQGPANMAYLGPSGGAGAGFNAWQANNLRLLGAEQRLLGAQSWIPDTGSDEAARQGFQGQIGGTENALMRRPNMGWQSEFASKALPFYAGAGFTMSQPGFNAGWNAGGATSWAANPNGLPLLTPPGTQPGWTPSNVNAGLYPNIPPNTMLNFSQIGPGGGTPGGVPPGGGAGYGGAGLGAGIPGGMGQGGGIPNPPPPGSYGPYFNQRFAQEINTGIGANANALWGMNDFTGFETLMSGTGNQWRRAGMAANANVGAFQSQYDFNRLQQPTSTGTPYAQFYAQQNLGNLNAQMDSAKLRGDEAAVNSLGGQIDKAKESLNEFNKSGEASGNMMTRMIGRMLIYAATFAAIGAAIKTVKDIAEEALRLEDVSARVGFISGQTTGQTQYQFTQAAAAGITPGQAGPGIITAAQLGSSATQQKQAQDIVMLSGYTEDYSRILLELNQTQERANALGITNVNIMDFLAESMKTMPGTFVDYTNAAQQGIQMSSELGISWDQMGLALERTVRTTGTSIDFISNLTQSTLSKLKDKDIQKDLKDKFGIAPGSPSDMIIGITDKIAELKAAGDPAGIQRLLETIQGPGLQGPARTRQLGILLNELVDPINGVVTALASMEDALTAVGGTGNTKIHQMTAAWRLFLASVSDTQAFKDVADAITLTLDVLTSHNQFGTTWSGLDKDKRSELLEQFTKETGIGTTQRQGFFHKLLGIDQSNDEPQLQFPRGTDPIEMAAIRLAFEQWILKNVNALPSIDPSIGEMRSDRDSRPGSVSAPGVKRRPIGYSTAEDRSLSEVQFGGFETFSKGQNWDQFEALTRKYEKLISAPGTGYELDRKQYQYLDEQTGLLRGLYADSNAIRYATEEQRKIMSQAFTGTFNVPSGGRIPFAALLAGFGPEGSGGGGVGNITAELKPSLDGMSGAAGQMSAAAVAFLNAITATMGRGPSSTPGRDTIPSPSDSRSRGAGTLTDSPTGADRWRRGVPTRHLTDEDVVEMQEGIRGPLSGRHIDPNRMRDMGDPTRPLNRMHAGQNIGRETADRLPAVPGRQIGMGAGSQRAGLSPIQLAVTNNIRVTIDGRQISHVQNRQSYRQFDSIRNSTGAPNNFVSA